jgi:hypothetical protein
VFSGACHVLWLGYWRRLERYDGRKDHEDRVWQQQKPQQPPEASLVQS